MRGWISCEYGIMSEQPILSPGRYNAFLAVVGKNRGIFGLLLSECQWECFITSVCFILWAHCFVVICTCCFWRWAILL